VRRPWSLISTLLTALGCVAFLTGIIAHTSWAIAAGAVLLAAAAVTNIIAILQTRRTTRPGDQGPPF
jgi:hypothetical protein